jgi:hypothetical protein
LSHPTLVEVELGCDNNGHSVPYQYLNYILFW